MWSAGPGIDLLSQPAVAVRAYVESRFLVNANADIAFAYPGFEAAVPPDSLTGPTSTQQRRTFSPSPAPHPIVGTQRYHLLRTVSNPPNRQTTAIVCDYSSYTSAYDFGDGNFGYPNTEPVDPVDGVRVLWIALQQVPGGTELPPQAGPARSPKTDVFDGWHIVGLLTSHAGTGKLDYPDEWPTQIADGQLCSDAAPDPPDRRRFLRAGVHPRSDYPTLPPYPGWPDTNLIG
ncbi:hypothetical protein [Mycolicibacterium palauense]|uniref:hypothetical protein n=1 Tax=Mycolicibacterium palauense TaxID=2034511 RepID=UPI001FE6B895|nr:hypothetical protein [Mycolicibacterium palauense]